MTNYYIFSNDRKDWTGGGTAMFAENTTVHNVCGVDELVNLKATAVEMVTATAGIIRLVSVSVPQIGRS